MSKLSNIKELTEITIDMPDDWHAHFRDEEVLAETIPASARQFGRSIAMPNLKPPVTNAKLAMEYKERMLAHVPNGSEFMPLVTLYLTNATKPEEIEEAKAQGVLAAKLYPAGATTNSNHGVNDISKMTPVFEAMEKSGMLLLIHGEVTDGEIDIFDREKVFIETYLSEIIKNHPKLKVVLEHITTKDAAEFVMNGPDNIAATITPQHLMLNRNDLLVGGIKPHYYCLPILKRNIHQVALREAVASGSKKFFLGTDSAPHMKEDKESACGCAGCYSAPAAIELYTHIFDYLNCLDKLEAFASHNGADFYGLPRNTKKVTLVRETWKIPNEIEVKRASAIVPFWAGSEVHWRLKS
jgi:dihydroorotase